MPDYSEQPADAAGLDADFAHRIKQRREFLGWTQEDLAQRLMQAGLPLQRQIVQRIETAGPNRRAVRFGEAITIARVLGISLDEWVQADAGPTLAEALDEAGYLTERAARAAEDQLRALRASQDHYGQLIHRAKQAQGRHEATSINDPTDLNDLGYHTAILDSRGPAYVVQRETIKGILGAVGGHYAPPPEAVPSDAHGDRWDWINALKAAWAISAVLSGEPTAHIRRDAERLVLLRDALRVVDALHEDYAAGLQQLRDEGLPLDDEVLSLSGIDAIGHHDG